MAPIRPILRDFNITEQQWRVLRVLENTDSMEASGVAAAALLYAPSVTRILKELDERGLVSRRADPDDGRRTIVAITAKGRTLLAKTAAHTLEHLNAYAKAFGPKRLKALQQELADFTQSISHLTLKD